MNILIGRYDDHLIKVQDPSNIPDVRCFAGFLGKSSKEKYWRILGEMIAGED